MNLTARRAVTVAASLAVSAAAAGAQLSAPYEFPNVGASVFRQSIGNRNDWYEAPRQDRRESSRSQESQGAMDGAFLTNNLLMNALYDVGPVSVANRGSGEYRRNARGSGDGDSGVNDGTLASGAAASNDRGSASENHASMFDVEHPVTQIATMPETAPENAIFTSPSSVFDCTNAASAACQPVAQPFPPGNFANENGVSGFFSDDTTVSGLQRNADLPTESIKVVTSLGDVITNPEPATLTLAATGLCAVLFVARRRKTRGR